MNVNTVRVDRVSVLGCDGTKIGLRIETADQWHKDVHMSVGDAAKFVSLILSTLVRNTPITPGASPVEMTTIPIPALRTGTGKTPAGEPLLAVDMGLLQLTFQLPSSADAPGSVGRTPWP